MMKKISLVMIAVLAMSAGCDWFEEQVRANLQPETELVECAAGTDTIEGDDVRFVWRGSDVDG
ncbi:MAG: hypothetical protein MUO50_03760, partial [Longimicrobiales bacterium]|nr:hypothetical protein [Longimicrobiales bacterium]